MFVREQVSFSSMFSFPAQFAEMGRVELSLLQEIHVRAWYSNFYAVLSAGSVSEGYYLHF